jgi:hypothetical protein
MPIKPVAGKIEAQPLNDNFSFLSSEVSKAKTGELIEPNSISSNQLKVSADADKIKQVNLSEEVLQMMAGNTPINAIPADGTLTTAKYANKSVSKDKLGFRYAVGIIKQGTINIDTVNNVLIANAGGVFVDNLSQYLVFSNHQVDMSSISPTAIKVIYFNVVTKLFQVYHYNAVPTNNPDIAFIGVFYNNQFTSMQDYNTLLLNGEKLTTQYNIFHDNLRTNYQYVAMLNGEVVINTSAKSISVPTCNIVWGGREIVMQAHSVDYSSLPSGAINMYYNESTQQIECYQYKNAAQLGKRLIIFGTLFNGKLHNSMNNQYVKIDNVPNGGWGYVDGGKKYTFSEAWNNWEGGNKFPIAFLGDSTTDGNTTSEPTRNVAGTDYINTYAYPYLLQQLIRQETNNSVMRVYNAGFSGKTAQWAKDNINSIFGSGTPYSDVKMVGISYGINDSSTDLISDYYNNFKTNIEWLINYFVGKGIQPFLVTTQATLMKKGAFAQSQTNKINTVANEIKFELADKYGLEIFDANHFTESFVMYSNEALSDIQPDSLHFGDVGHKYEADFYFNKICPRVINSNRHKFLSMLNQNIKTQLTDSNISRSTSSKYKYIVDYTRAETTDILIMDALLFNNEDSQLKLNVTGNVDLYINDVLIDPLNHELDLGLHHVQVRTTLTDVYFEGIDIVRV